MRDPSKLTGADIIRNGIECREQRKFEARRQKQLTILSRRLAELSGEKQDPMVTAWAEQLLSELEAVE